MRVSHVGARSDTARPRSYDTHEQRQLDYDLATSGTLCRAGRRPGTSSSRAQCSPGI